MHILVSNLHHSVVEADLRRLFLPFGEINTVEIVRDKNNHRPSGKALIDMPVNKEASQAVLTVDGTVLAGKVISVTELV